MPLNVTVKVHRIEGQKTRGEGNTNGQKAAEMEPCGLRLMHLPEITDSLLAPSPSAPHHLRLTILTSLLGASTLPPISANLHFPARGSPFGPSTLVVRSIVSAEEVGTK